MRGAMSRKPVTERRNVNRVAPITVALEVLAVVAFQQLQMRRCIVARVDPSLRLIRIPSAEGVIGVVVCKDVAATSSAHGVDLVAVP